MVTRANTGVRRDMRPPGTTAPSRTAAIGGTRVARIAGMTPASRVMRVPTTRETTIVRVSKTVFAWGMSAPTARKMADSPLARA